METKLGKTIVIPGDAYQSCISQLIDDLWEDDRFDRLIEDDTELPPLTTDDLRYEWQQVRRVLRRPPVERPSIAARWPLHDQRRIAHWLLSVRVRVAEVQSLRVSPRRLEGWLWGQPRIVSRDDVDPMIVGLAWTWNYGEWMRQGGHPDVGRYLGCWATQFYDRST